MNIPTKIERLLEAEKICFLATSHKDHPHVCLMNFTYLADEGLIILSSRSDTTKVKNIEKNPKVALLFYNMGSGKELPVSCTLFGIASVLPPDKAELYKKLHYENHPDMGTFITAKNITVISVGIKGATLSDVKDRVHSWSAGGSFKHDPSA